MDQENTAPQTKPLDNHYDSLGNTLTQNYSKTEDADASNQRHNSQQEMKDRPVINHHNSTSEQLNKEELTPSRSKQNASRKTVLQNQPNSNKNFTPNNVNHPITQNQSFHDNSLQSKQADAQRNSQPTVTKKPDSSKLSKEKNQVPGSITQIISNDLATSDAQKTIELSSAITKVDNKDATNLPVLPVEYISKDEKQSMFNLLPSSQNNNDIRIIQNISSHVEENLKQNSLFEGDKNNKFVTRFGIKGLRAQNFAGGLMGQAAILNKRKTRKDFNGRNPRFKTISNPKDEGFTGEDLVDAFDFGQSLINFDRDKGNSLKNSQNQIEENSYRKVISPKMHMIRLSPVDDQNNSSSIHSRYPPQKPKGLSQHSYIRKDPPKTSSMQRNERVNFLSQQRKKELVQNNYKFSNFFGKESQKMTMDQVYKIKSIINQERPKNEIKPAEKKELDISKSIITNIDTSKFDQSIFGQKLPSVQLAGESVLFGNQKGISTVPNSSYQAQTGKISDKLQNNLRSENLMMEDSLQSQEFNCKFEPLKGNDSKRRFNSIFYEENDSCNSGFNMASMRSEVRMNALAFNLSTVTNATKMNLQKRIFTNQFKRQFANSKTDRMTDLNSQRMQSGQCLQSFNLTNTETAKPQGGEKYYPKIKYMFNEPRQIKYGLNKTIIRPDMQIKVKNTFEIINKHIEERNNTIKQKKDIAQKMIDKVFKNKKFVQAFDYQALKDGIKIQKESLLKSKKPLGKIYQQPEALQKASIAFQQKNNEQLISILQKLNEAEQVNIFWSTISVRLLAQEVKYLDPALSEQLLRLCNEKNEKDGDQVSEIEIEMRNFLNSLLQDRNKYLLDHDDIQFLLPELSEIERRELIKSEFVKSLVNDMKVSQKKRKFTSSSPTQKYLNTLKTTKNTKLKMLITSKVVVKKSNDQDQKISTFNTKSLISLLKLNQNMTLIFDENSLNDVYRQSGNVFSTAPVHENENLVNSLQKSWFQAQKFHQNWPAQDFQNKIENPSYNQIFDKKVKAIKFYNDVKVPTVQNRYKDTIEDAYEVPIPDFVKINENKLYLSEMNIHQGQFKALTDYIRSQAGEKQKYIEANPLSKTKKVLSQDIILSLIIDNCCMNDEQLSQILESCVMQGHLREFEYMNNSIGPKSVQALVKILNEEQSGIFLRDLKLMNLSGMNNSMMADLATAISQSQTLIKLKLSNLNMSLDNISKHLISMVQNSRTLTHLDLSWSNLTAKQLHQLLQAAQLNQNQLRHLNISYKNIGCSNRKNLNRPEIEKDIDDFVDSLKQYINQSTTLNLLNISGIDFIQKQVTEIADCISNSPVLLSVHMNDLDINNNDELRDEILDIFAIENSRFNEQIERTQNKNITKSESIKKAIIQLNKPLNNKKMQDYDQNVELSDYNKFLKKGQQRKFVRDSINQNISNWESGIGRQPMPHDNFVITRKLQFPELVFNQNKYLDEYFDPEAYKQWNISNKGECFLSQKHKLVTIIYDPDTIESNKDFIQITDKNFKNYLKTNLNMTQQDFQINQPVIFGTVTHGWNRKLRMLDACIYAFLSVSERQELKWNHGLVQDLKKDIIEVNKYQNIDSLVDEGNQGDGLDVRANFSGFMHILQDKLQLNKEIDQVTIGLSTQDQDLVNNDHEKEERPFVYSEFLPTGHHQFVIYDPDNDKFFIHDFFLDINQEEISYTTKKQELVKPKKIVANVWRPWIEDKPKDLVKIYGYDSRRINTDKGHKYFQPQILIPQKHEISNMHKVFEKHYKIILAMYKTIQFKCKKFPELEFKEILKFFEDIQSDKFFSTESRGIDDSKADKMMEEELKVDINEELIEDELQSLSDGNSELSEGDQRLTQRSFENAFICSNRLSKDRSLRGTLNRSEWINFILRLIQYRYGLRVGKDKRWAKTSDYLKDFIHDFFNSEYQKSEIFAVRKVIRESTTLNQFLIDNKKILTAIFDHCKEKEDQCHNNYHDHSNKGDCKKFDRGSAIYLLYQHLHPIYLNVQNDYQYHVKKREQKLEQLEKKRLSQILCGQTGSPMPRRIEDSDEDLDIQEPMGPKERIHMYFSFSQMTVFNEQKHFDRYFELKYVEFLEFFCRAANYIENESKFGVECQPLKVLEKRPIYQSVYQFLQKCQNSLPDIGSMTITPPNPQDEQLEKAHINLLHKAASQQLSQTFSDNNKLEDLEVPESQKQKLMGNLRQALAKLLIKKKTNP